MVTVVLSLVMFHLSGYQTSTPASGIFVVPAWTTVASEARTSSDARRRFMRALLVRSPETQSALRVADFSPPGRDSNDRKRGSRDRCWPPQCVGGSAAASIVFGLSSPHRVGASAAASIAFGLSSP